jgi:hypothetical protein
VGLGRLERPTSRLSGVRSNQLSYRPEGYPKRPRHGTATGGTDRDLGLFAQGDVQTATRPLPPCIAARVRAAGGVPMKSSKRRDD